MKDSQEIKSTFAYKSVSLRYFTILFWICEQTFDWKGKN